MLTAQVDVTYLLNKNSKCSFSLLKMHISLARFRCKVNVAPMQWKNH